jgi:hypothetical protein
MCYNSIPDRLVVMDCPNCEHGPVKLVDSVRVTQFLLPASLSHCQNCDFLFLADPSWLNLAYQREFFGDTGYMKRNLDLHRLLISYFSLVSIFRCIPKDFMACDIGAGLGVFARLMRDRGFSFFGLDEYSSMPLIQPFVLADCSSVSVKTAFEVVEHVPSLPDFMRLHDVASSKIFIFSTLLRPDGAVPGPDWKYYCFPQGQHISFHSKKSLRFAFSRCGVDWSSFCSIHPGLHIVSPDFGLRRLFRLAYFLRKRGLDRLAIPLMTCLSGRQSLTGSDHAMIMARD